MKTALVVCISTITTFGFAEPSAMTIVDDIRNKNELIKAMPLKVVVSESVKSYFPATEVEGMTTSGRAIIRHPGAKPNDVQTSNLMSKVVEVEPGSKRAYTDLKSTQTLLRRDSSYKFTREQNQRIDMPDGKVLREDRTDTIVFDGKKTKVLVSRVNLDTGRTSHEGIELDSRFPISIPFFEPENCYQVPLDMTGAKVQQVGSGAIKSLSVDKAKYTVDTSKGNFVKETQYDDGTAKITTECQEPVQYQNVYLPKRVTETHTYQNQINLVRNRKIEYLPVTADDAFSLSFPDDTNMKRNPSARMLIHKLD